MKCRCLVLFGALVAMVAVASVSIAAQALRTAAGTADPTWTPLRTAWGDPDLEGIWRGMHRVPFERPPKYEGREFLTDGEVAEMERRGEESNALRLAGKLENRGFRSQPNYNSVIGYSADRIRVSKRTSAIIDPPDGRLPPWTLEQVNAYEMREEFGRGRGEADWTIDRPPSERCINVVSAGLLGLWGMANAGRSQFYSAVRGSESFVRPEAFAGGEEFTNSGSPGAPRRILQAPGHVAITQEESDEYTIIPLDGRPHLGAKFLQWMGDVRGHWEGNTLVVETTNIKYPYPIIYSYASLYPGSGETLRLTERFTRVGPDTIEYRYTIDDPKVYTRPYTVLYELTRDDNYKVTAPICHEGHDDMPSALAAGRVDEEGATDNAEDARLLRKPRLEELKQQALKAAEEAKR